MADLKKAAYGGKTYTIPTYDDTALANRVSANETAIADRYTKEQTDEKIAEAMTDVDNEHFHVVTVLPDAADAKENHEYVLVTYEPGTTTIATEVHYLFYDGEYHQRTTTVSLDGYATEQYVDDEITGLATNIETQISATNTEVMNKANTSDVTAALATKQDTLVSGTNIKTVQGVSILGSGDIPIDIQGMVEIDTSKQYTHTELKEIVLSGRVVVNHEGMKRIMTTFDYSDNNSEGMNYVNVYTSKSAYNASPTQTRYEWWGYIDTPDEPSELTVSDQPLILLRDDVRSGLGTQPVSAKAVRDYVPWYITCDKDTAGSGNVVQIGIINDQNSLYYVYQFFYRTGNLPNATSGDYSFANLLANYTVKEFIDATGITTNGIFIGNGRTDNNNRLIVQQFSKNNKTVTIRTYQDFSSHTALLKIQFIGTKNA